MVGSERRGLEPPGRPTVPDDEGRGQGADDPRLAARRRRGRTADGRPRSLTLRIGPHRVRVISDPATDVQLADADLLGDSDATRLTIRIRSDLPTSVWHDTLVHEVLHHVLALTHLATSWSDDDEEAVVRTLTPHLVQLGLLKDVVDRR